jgi:hypothetical protein
MVQINPSDLPALPVEQLAQFLLGCAREDPTLLARSNSGPVVRRDADIRVPLGRPIDLTGMEDDAPAARAVAVPPMPVDASPTAEVPAEVLTARPDFLARRLDVLRPGPDAPSRRPAIPPPVIPSFRPSGPSPAPVVPSFSPIVPSPTPISALHGLGSGFPRQIEALSGPIETAPTPGGVSAHPVGPSVLPIETPAYLFEALERRSVRPALPPPTPGESAFSPGDVTGRSPLTPGDALSVTSAIGPIDATAEPIVIPTGRPDAAPILVEGLPGPVDATARMVAQKLQLRRTDARDDPELEELVSIAVACARRAEDAVQQAREIHWMARRRMSIVAAVTGAGVLAASAVGIIDRYQTTGERRSTASAFLTGPMIADVAGFPASPGSSPRPDTAQAAPSVAEADGTVTPSADLVRAGDIPRSVAEGSSVSPSSARAPVASAAAAPAKSAPAPIAATAPVAVAASVPSAVPPPVPAPSRAAPVAAAVTPTRPSAVADGRTASPPATQQFAAAVPPQARAVEPSRPAAAETPTRSPEMVAPTGNVEATGEPLQYGEASAPPDVPPGPQVSHPVRHARKVARRPVYYVQGPGVLLAQVVYGVRRNLYEIFH